MYVYLCVCMHVRVRVSVNVSVWECKSVFVPALIHKINFHANVHTSTVEHLLAFDAICYIVTVYTVTAEMCKDKGIFW